MNENLKSIHSPVGFSGLTKYQRLTSEEDPGALAFLKDKG